MGKRVKYRRTGELVRLKRMLDRDGIRYEWRDRDLMLGGQICLPDCKAFFEGRGISVVQGKFTYGGPEGYVEIWRKIEGHDEEPDGWIVAEEALKKIKEGLTWLESLSTRTRCSKGSITK